MNMAAIKQYAWAILACLLALGVALLAVMTFEARRPDASDMEHARARNDLRVLLAALNGYQLERQAFPDTSAGLQELHAAGILPHVPFDPWGRPYVYRHPGHQRDIELLSTGPDGLESADDIAIWRLYSQR